MRFVSKLLMSGGLALAIVLFFSPLSLSQTSYVWDWSSDVNFGLTSYNTKICFDSSMLLGGFTFYGTSIKFTDILLDSHVDEITLSTQTANMTVTVLEDDRLDYNVTGSGTQVINIGLAPDSVTLDGSPIIEGMGYSYDSGTKDVTVTGASEDAIILFSSGGNPGGTIQTAYTSALFQYVLEGDLIGFVLACYTQTVGSIFYAICIFFISSVIYIRQKSLFAVSLIWLFVGGSFITLFWEFSFVAVWFTILGVAGIVVEFILVWRRGH